MAGRDEVPTGRIRNVVLVGHAGTGKTALAEALLDTGGALRPGSRGGILDFEPEERERGHSLSLALASTPWRGHKINLLDAPGGPDVVGDAYPALRAADVAVFVVDATVGVQAQHDQLWPACAAAGLPRVVYLNKLEKTSAAYQRNIDALRERYGKPLAPVHMPIGVEAEFTGVIDLLNWKAVRKGSDGERAITEVPAERAEQAESNRELLVEAIVEQDDDLLERYLEGEVPSADELAKCFAEGVAEQSFFPVLCGSVETRIGVRLLGDFLVDVCPAPPASSPDEPATIYVTKTLSDPYVGRINILRVLTGRLEADASLTVARTGTSVRLHQLFSLLGKEQTPVPAAPAGDIVAVAKLDDVLTADLLHAGDAPPAIEPVPMPEPFHRVGLEPASAGDEEKLSTALGRIAEEDPSLRIEREQETRQLVLRCLGPGHVDVTLARMERKFGVSVVQVPVRIPYRETLRASGEGIGKHVKQSGGHGQYGIAEVEVEPLPRGTGFVFEDRIVGGVIPRQFIPSVEKGMRDTLERGVLTGYPVADVRVRLVDGKHHSVDSSDMAFQMAGSLAFRDAAGKAGIVLLEPIMEVAVTIPDELTGDVMGDLSSRRGRIQGTEAAGGGRTTVTALVPQADVVNYTAELRSLSSGTGTVTMRYDHHDQVPDHLAEKVIARAQQEAAGG